MPCPDGQEFLIWVVSPFPFFFLRDFSLPWLLLVSRSLSVSSIGFSLFGICLLPQGGGWCLHNNFSHIHHSSIPPILCSLFCFLQNPPLKFPCFCSIPLICLHLLCLISISVVIPLFIHFLCLLVTLFPFPPLLFLSFILFPIVVHAFLSS